MDLAQWWAGVTARPFPYAAVAAAGLVLAGVVSWSKVLMVVLGRVVPGWMLGGALILGSLVLMGIGAVRRRRPAVDDRATATATARQPVSPGYAPRRFVYVVLTVLAVASVGFGALGDLGARYLVLRPSGPDGCTAVVRETAFLMAGTGEVYGVGGSTGVAWGPSGSWFADDGYRPIAEGSYELSWGRTDGVLVVSGSGGNPVYPAIHDVDCG